MSQVQPRVPQQPLPQQQSSQQVSLPAQSTQSSRALSPRAVAAIVLGAFGATVLCAGGIGGLGYVAIPSARDALEEADMLPRGLTPSFNANAWAIQRALGEIYQASLEAVIDHADVVERLGEPIETDLAAPELYHRANSALRITNEETIEYELIGSKGRCTVTVTAKSASATHPGMPGPLRIEKISVALEDGTVLEASPPPAQDPHSQ